VAELPFRALALVCAGACLLTGVFLAASYAPTWASAQPAVAAMQHEVSLGWMLRGLHHWGGTLAIVLVALDLAVRFARGAHRERRAWIDAVVLLVVLVGFAYTGYLLVGDARAYAGIVVLDGVLRATPYFGDAIAGAVIGGPVASDATLARLYVLHAVVLPAVLLWLARADRPAIARHAWAGCGILAVLAVLAWALPVAVGEAGAPGQPPAPDAQPEWFFLWVNELLHRVEGRIFLVGAVLPLGLLVLLFAAPSLTKRMQRGAALAGGGIVLAGVVALSALAAGREPETAPAEEEDAPAPMSAETEEALARTLRRFRCVSCHRIAGDPDGGEDGPPLPRGEEFAELYTRTFFRAKVGDPQAFWADTGMVYPRNRKPDAEQLALLERYFFGD